MLNTEYVKLSNLLYNSSCVKHATLSLYLWWIICHEINYTIEAQNILGNGKQIDGS